MIKSQMALTVLMVVSLGCTKMSSTASSMAASSSTSQVGGGGGGGGAGGGAGGAGTTSSSGPIVAGNGDKVSGTGALSVPTADAVVARLTNGLGGNVKPTAGNFAKALAQVRGNLPKVTDPMAATGFDQVQLLVYAACSDLTTGNPSMMQSKYGVTASASVASNQSALLAAGMKMLDQYTAGLASGGPTSTQVQQSLSSLIQQMTGISGNTSTMTFMSVCIAANTAGATLLGF